MEVKNKANVNVILVSLRSLETSSQATKETLSVCLSLKGFKPMIGILKDRPTRSIIASRTVYNVNVDFLTLIFSTTKISVNIPPLNVKHPKQTARNTITRLIYSENRSRYPSKHGNPFGKLVYQMTVLINGRKTPLC